MPFVSTGLWIWASAFGAGTCALVYTIFTQMNCFPFVWNAEAAYFNRLLSSVGLISNAGLQRSHSGLGTQALAFRTCNILHHRYATGSYIVAHILTSLFTGRRSLHKALKYPEGIYCASMVLYIRNLAGLGDVHMEGHRCSLNRSWQELCSPVNSSFRIKGLSETTFSAHVRTALGGFITVGTSFFGGETIHTPSYFVLFPRKANFTLHRGSFFVCPLESLVLENRDSNLEGQPQMWPRFTFSSTSFSVQPVTPFLELICEIGHFFQTVFNFAGNKLHLVVACLGEWKSYFPITGILLHTWAIWIMWAPVGSLSFSLLWLYSVVVDVLTYQ